VPLPCFRSFAIKKYGQTESGRRNFGRAGLVLLMVGVLIVIMAMDRFAPNITLLLNSAVPKLEALTVIKGVFQTSPIFREAITRAQSRVAAGRLARRNRPVYPDDDQPRPHWRAIRLAPP
jgi:type II secretory pathway component PulF